MFSVCLSVNKEGATDPVQVLSRQVLSGGGGGALILLSLSVDVSLFSRINSGCRNVFLLVLLNIRRGIPDGRGTPDPVWALSGGWVGVLLVLSCPKDTPDKTTGYPAVPPVPYPFPPQTSRYPLPSDRAMVWFATPREDFLVLVNLRNISKIGNDGSGCHKSFIYNYWTK